MCSSRFGLQLNRFQAEEEEFLASPTRLNFRAGSRGSEAAPIIASEIAADSMPSDLQRSDIDAASASVRELRVTSTPEDSSAERDQEASTEVAADKEELEDVEVSESSAVPVPPAFPGGVNGGLGPAPPPGPPPPLMVRSQPDAQTRKAGKKGTKWKPRILRSKAVRVTGQCDIHSSTLLCERGGGAP